ncbi:MAG: ABC transporter ATP-binding protein/permease [Acholeplasma sp.]|nr:ABC transporter ATP-binding protein/permease [Acholeplasma sp.]
MIKLEGVSKYYNSDSNVVLGLRRVNLEFKLGEFIAITGESGSGKSTLMNVISGLDKYDEGEMFVNGEETSYFSVEEQEQYRKQYIGFVFQNYNIIDSFTVFENVMAALMIQGYDPKKRKARALELIDKVGLTSHKNHRASKLSGGQKQRAVIARALAKDCPIIVADEPTGNLDSKTGLMIMALLKEVSKDKLVIVVTHNYEQAEPYVTRKIRLSDGEVVEDKPIKPKEEVNPYEPKPTVNLAILDVLKLAFISIFRMPKKSILLFITLLFALVSSASLLSLNNFIPKFVSGGGAGGGNYYSEVFRNIYPERLIVKKTDNSIITQAELDNLSNMSGIKGIIHYDHIQDSHFRVLMKGADFDKSYSPKSPLPSSAANPSMLKEGRLPEDNTEVVLKENDYEAFYKLGDEVYLMPSEVYSYSETYENTRFVYTLTVVGIIEDYSRDDLILHDTFLNQTTTNELNKNNVFAMFAMERRFSFDDSPMDQYYYRSIVIDNSIPVGKIALNMNSRNGFVNSTLSMTDLERSQVPIVISQVHGDFEEFDSKSLYVSNYHLDYDNYSNYNFGMHEDTYMDVFTLKGTYQASLILNNPDNHGEVKSKLPSGFIAFHPYSAPTEPDFTSTGLKTMTNFVFFFLALFIYIILNLVLKSIIQSRKKDFVIFRSIGASQIDLKRMLMLEQVVYVSIGFVLMFIPLIIMNQRIDVFKVLEHLKFRSYLIIYGAFLLILLMIARKFSIKLFGRSVITTLKSE